MARLILSDDEDLIVRFRPHPGSRAGRYLADLFWVGYGVLAWWFSDRIVPQFEWAAPFAFAALAVAHAVTLRLLDLPGIAWPVAWAGIGLALWIAALVPQVPDTVPTRLIPVALGALATLVALFLTEFDRRRRTHFLTTRRLVVRGGVRFHTERSIPADHVESVHAGQSALGQLFGFATITITRTLPASRKRRDAAPAPEIIPGVPRWEEVHHAFEELLAEQRLAPKERQRRVEERRVKDSMRALANWAQRG